MMCLDFTLGHSKLNENSQFKSAYNSRIIGLRGLQCETNLWEIMS